ncbi:adenine nucleotide alpha hydrolase [Notoacmeibacter sp. MSK16QG-6]|uniref:adenine nucleotide alpha hydrolase n=1 Tax=Notoacmeibacter sp. MSK16QG-6 TaxID=2957982 RepID=UPI00209C934B|nr:adenine nucleotide alpha hydrolase [Notoacmeibacter sp. MSK16QG-6]MCP1199565.1 adenine nucleotide alpha hydrolase [Notoacmeibacter sp. MSK16QG-6]
MIRQACAAGDVSAAFQKLNGIFASADGWAIAVSGGVDSVTLAAVAQRAGLSVAPVIVHAVSPAVPSDALPRLQSLANAERWDLRIVYAAELEDASYRANPYNRCYFCKSALYTTMLRQLSDRMENGMVLASGANMDDLGEHRPGLIAASEHGVRHPLIEAGIGKPMIRSIASYLGLSGFESLPAQPCLASRIETGIPIAEGDLRFIDELEGRLRDITGHEATLRARLRREGVVVELDPSIYGISSVAENIDSVCAEVCANGGYVYAGLQPYRRGSAFVKALET